MRILILQIMSFQNIQKEIWLTNKHGVDVNWIYSSAPKVSAAKIAPYSIYKAHLRTKIKLGLLS